MSENENQLHINHYWCNRCRRSMKRRKIGATHSTEKEFSKFVKHSLLLLNFERKRHLPLLRKNRTVLKRFSTTNAYSSEVLNENWNAAVHCIEWQYYMSRSGRYHCYQVDNRHKKWQKNSLSLMETHSNKQEWPMGIDFYSEPSFFSPVFGVRLFVLKTYHKFYDTSEKWLGIWILLLFECVIGMRLSTERERDTQSPSVVLMFPYFLTVQNSTEINGWQC